MVILYWMCRHGRYTTSLRDVVMDNVIIMQGWRNDLDALANEMEGHGAYVMALGVKMCADSIDAKIKEIIKQGVIVIK